MARGRWVAALAAVATLACGLAGPAAQADELSDLKEAAARARSAYDEAVSDRDALKPARDKAQAVLDEGSIGYFKARGATDAVRILNDDGTLTGHDYASDVRKMKTGGLEEYYATSATTLDNMLTGLEVIRTMNLHRAEEGTSPKGDFYADGGGKTLEPLQVTDSLMAVAEIHSDRMNVANESKHYRDFNISENICGDDLDACYYGEKEQFNGELNHHTGHYLNIVSSNNKATGSSQFTQVFDTSTEWLAPADEIAHGDLSQGRVMSVDDYEADVKAYKAPYDKAVSDYDTAAKAADDAKAAYEKAKQAVTDWNNTMFTVSFDTAGGTAVESQKVRRGSTATRPADPVRGGYTFQSWYAGDSKYDFSTPVNADTTLTAHWKADTTEPKFFTVSFEPDNGQPNWGDCIGAGLTVPKPADPTRDGYTFDGWYQGDAKYDFSTPVNADLTLTARWTRNENKPAVKNGWVVENGTRHWYENGRMARSHAFYDKASDAWYWADADGSIARDKDVFIPKDETDRSKGGKWVRFDGDSRMVKGEQHSTKAGHVGWYWFDPTTGEMAKGMRHIGSNGGKWVYYDATTGIMAHGERYVNYDRAHTGWYHFNETTGAMTHGDVYVRSNGGKWVRYDRTTGIMVHGLQYQDGSWYWFDRNTGAMAHGRTWVPDWHAWHDFDRVTGRG